MKHLESSWKICTPRIFFHFFFIWGESQIITIWDFWKQYYFTVGVLCPFQTIISNSLFTLKGTVMNGTSCVIVVFEFLSRRQYNNVKLQCYWWSRSLGSIQLLLVLFVHHRISAALSSMQTPYLRAHDGKVSLLCDSKIQAGSSSQFSTTMDLTSTTETGLTVYAWRLLSSPSWSLLATFRV